MSLTPGLLEIAHQLRAALLQEIDHEIEIERLVSDGRYARDVLLVCDACPGAVLRHLASQFRALVPTPDHTDDGVDADPSAALPASMVERAMATALADARPEGAATGFDLSNFDYLAHGPASAAANPGSWPGVPALDPTPGPQRQQAPATAAARTGPRPRPTTWLQKLWARWRRR